MFGIGAELDEGAWRSVIRQLIALRFVCIDHDAHGGLRLTETARPVLKGEQQVAMRRTAPRKGGGARPSSGRAARHAALSDADDALLQRLKAWRLDQSRAQAVPAYVILHDRTLAEIASQRPHDLGKLAGIAGIGATKLERYGPALVEIVSSA